MRGILALFRDLDSTVDAIHDLKKQRAGEVTVFSPTPRHEIEHAINTPASPVRLFTLIGGLVGVTCGYWVAIWISNYWPMVVGGKAFASWVPYTIIGFEVMVMFGALATVVGMMASSRIPRLTMMVGYDPRVSAGHYGIFVECPPEKQRDVEQLLRSHGAEEVRGER